MIRKWLKILCCSIALVLLVVPIAMAESINISEDQAVFHDTVLSDSAEYGIVTHLFDLQSGDAETNVAANESVCLTQAGNTRTNEMDQPFILPSVDGVFNIKGYPAYVYTTEETKDKIIHKESELTYITNYSKEELDDIINSMIANAETQSSWLAGQDSGAKIAYDLDSQKYILDIRDSDPGIYCVMVDEETYNSFAQENGKLRLYYNPDGQTLVLNVRGDVLRFEKFLINDLSPESIVGETTAYPKTLFWNFVDATELHITGSVMGTILAPSATVKLDATSGGWLIADKVYVGNGEWHNVNPSQPEPPDIPDEPDKPDPPDEPDKPDPPDEPDVPIIPAEPETPEEPSKPITPVPSITPSKPSITPQEIISPPPYTTTPIKHSSIPKTGDNILLPIVVGGVGIISLIIGIIAWKKRKQ